MITKERREELRRMLETCSGGDPWQWNRKQLEQMDGEPVAWAGDEGISVACGGDRYIMAAARGVIPALLDALDEMERERDAALTARIHPVEIRPGDALIVRISGWVECVAQSAEAAHRVFSYVRKQLDLAGFPSTPIILLDVGDGSAAVLRAVQEDEELRAMRAAYRYDETKRGDL